MSGLDDLIAGAAKSAGGGQSGGGLEDLLGGLLGGGGAGAGTGGSGGGLDDILGGLLGGGGGSGSPATTGGGGAAGMAGIVTALLPMLQQFLSSGGLDDLLGKMRANGFSAQADSWVSDGDNEPVSGQELRAAVGGDAVRRLADQAGISEDEAADVLAGIVPQVVSGLTPGGRVPSDDDLGRLAAALGSS